VQIKKRPPRRIASRIQAFFVLFQLMISLEPEKDDETEDRRVSSKKEIRPEGVNSEPETTYNARRVDGTSKIFPLRKPEQMTQCSSRDLREKTHKPLSGRIQLE